MDVRKITIVGIFVCAALLLLAVVVGRYTGVRLGQDGDLPWNAQTIRTSLAAVRVKELDPQHAAVVFVYDVENRGNSDYRLANGANFVIMNRLKDGGSLAANDQAALDSDAFVPAGNRSRVSLAIGSAFDWPSQKNAASEQSFRDLVARQVNGVRSFVLFDQTARYQIELPAELSALQQPIPATEAN